MQRLRDDPGCADEEFEAILDDEDPGLVAHVPFALAPVTLPSRPQVAIFREQGVNGQLEMAAAFLRAGFDPVDVHMSELLAGRVDLMAFPALVACGGFSYGDVLGGGGGWAKSILLHGDLRERFAAYFEADRLVLGVCNGCQMLTLLRSLIPGAEAWPEQFIGNRSRQFEGRTVLVRVNDVGSPWLTAMGGSVLPVAVAHGEGRAEFAGEHALSLLQRSGQLALQYVDGRHAVTQRYPFNPNGGPEGLAGMTAANGRVLAMMPHPERVFRMVQHGVPPVPWKDDGPWLRLFQNAAHALR